MSRNLNRAATARARKKKSYASLMWLVAAAAVVITLLILEQVALLYVLSTLAIVALLVVVSFTDLRGAKQKTAQAAPLDDSAAIGDRTANAAPAAPFGSPAPRPARNRQRR